jgi:hypothetical protein
MAILLKKKGLINDFFVDIIILHMLNYFQLLYDYFSLILIISPYIIYGYLSLFHPRLLLVILTYFTLGNLQLL